MLFFVTTVSSFAVTLHFSLECQPFPRLVWSHDLVASTDPATDPDMVRTAGSLFPSLYRMEQAGWLVSSWGESETKRKSKFYRLTKSGRKRLRTESERWERISLAMASALRAT